MLVAIHQPNFAPWLGVFHKMARADLFVLLDDVQFIKRGYIHRNYIKTPRGKEHFGVPVLTKGRYYQEIRATEILEDEPWRERLLRTLQHQYARAPYFKQYYEPLAVALQRGRDRLIDVNLEVLAFLRQTLQLDCPLVRASELPGVQGTSTERLVSICQSVGATGYLSGAGGKKYMDEEQFTRAGIRLLYSDFVPAPYPQLHGDFIECLSALDLVFNVGPESPAFLSTTRSAAA